MEGKHGSQMFHVKHRYVLENTPVQAERVPVLVHDNTESGIDHETRRKIAEKAITQNIYFNECESYYWMFDFNVWNHWCEMVHQRDAGHLLDPLEINVYE